eukprot:1692622-Rhodomonas_salina.2
MHSPACSPPCTIPCPMGHSQANTPRLLPSLEAPPFGHSEQNPRDGPYCPALHETGGPAQRAGRVSLHSALSPYPRESAMSQRIAKQVSDSSGASCCSPRR